MLVCHHHPHPHAGPADVRRSAVVGLQPCARRNTRTSECVNCSSRAPRVVTWRTRASCVRVVWRAPCSRQQRNTTPSHCTYLVIATPPPPPPRGATPSTAATGTSRRDVAVIQSAAVTDRNNCPQSPQSTWRRAAGAGGRAAAAEVTWRWASVRQARGRALRHPCAAAAVALPLLPLPRCSRGSRRVRTTRQQQQRQ